MTEEQIDPLAAAYVRPEGGDSGKKKVDMMELARRTGDPKRKGDVHKQFEAEISQLVEMGFPPKQARSAMKRGGSLENAMSYLVGDGA